MDLAARKMPIGNTQQLWKRLMINDSARKPVSPSSPRTLIVAGLALALGAMASPLAQALTFDVTYDASVSGAPSGFTTAFQDALSFYENTFSNPISINIDVGWGVVGGQSLNVTLGANQFNYYQNASYTMVQSALSQATTDILPASDPSGRGVSVNYADAKALGLVPDNSAIDGAVVFSTAVQWTFDPNNRAVSGEYDFIGVALHEVSEVMGRISLLNVCDPNCHESVLDLYRYIAPGQLDIVGTNAYFSIDGGNTVINTFNGNKSVGDLGDWTLGSADSFNYALGTGQLSPVTAGDIKALQALGYTLTTPVPEPSDAALLLAGLLFLLPRLRAVRRAS
jgi:hypothetical protein